MLGKRNSTSDNLNYGANERDYKTTQKEIA